MASKISEAKQRRAPAKTSSSRSSEMSTANTTSSSVGAGTASSAGSIAAAKKSKTSISEASRSTSRTAAPKASTKMAAPPPRVGSMKPGARAASPAKKSNSVDCNDNEAIKAYLRIRPASEEAGKIGDEPYIEVINETEVLMSPPKSSTAARARVYSTAMPTKYSFSHVFPGQAATSQSSFFKETTLPLVDELMQGQSGLIFTYGVTNSGKSYTVQGGTGAGEAGILPRSMDTIFNSIKGLESTSEIRPVGLAGVERADGGKSSANGIDPFSIPGLSKKVPVTSRPVLQYEHDPTKVRVDRNYRYSIWVSYVEVYNEKIFDLLDATSPSSSSTPRSSTFGGGMTRSDSVRGSNWTLASLLSDAGPIYLQRKPLTLKNDAENGGKYVAGLQEIRVNSAAEARELLVRGQENRQVFGTMANRASSRSHGVFTVKVIREHAGEDDLMIACSTSRLSIVDLAGSERLGNTAVTGDRLKEAGSINKSLMCLGQCLETLRKNQTRAASFIPMPSPISSTAGPTAATSILTSTRALKRRPSIVPFRHSKLTELFQSFFTGEGRAVMIVNVNPYDTGFDENSHVMRFSAAAKEVQTIRSHGQTTSLSRFVHPSLRDLFHPGASPVQSPAQKAATSQMPMTPKGSVSTAVKKAADRVTAAKEDPKPTSANRSELRAKSTSTPTSKPTSNLAASDSMAQEVTIIEEAEEDEEDGESDSFVDHLMVKYEEVRHRLFQSEQQCAQIEAQVREEMAEEMSRKLQEMESIFNTQMLQDSSMQEDFINRKLDLMGKAAFKAVQRDDDDDDDNDNDNDEEEVDEVERSLRSQHHRRHRPSSEAEPMEDETLMSEAAEDAEDDADDDAEEEDESALVIISRRKGALAKKALPESSSEEEEEEADNSMIEHEPVAKSAGGNEIDSKEGQADHTVESVFSSEEEDSDDDDEEEEEEEGEEGEEYGQEAAEEEAESSDESFGASDESLESSFEAAPKRTSRGRTSKSVATQKSIKAASKRPKASTAASRKRAPPASRKSTNGLPLFERSANISISTGDQSSDGSLILADKPVKSPKKKR
ncbi:hypothetical protein CBS101457_000752 [Exobasidium rhododendri]|nr:hypothetical protein CBS101457_000752 [Exobasidium rhododendri]